MQRCTRFHDYVVSVLQTAALCIACTLSLLGQAVAQDATCPPIPPTLPTATAAHTGVRYETAAHNGQTTLDLYLPTLAPGAPKPPIVMLVHGGGWIHNGNPAGYIEDATYLTHFGYAVAIVRYRLATAGDPSTLFPAAVQDLRCAVRFLRADTAAYPYNPAKVGALGGSAGGNLVAMLGVLPAHQLPANTFTDTPACAAGTAGKSSSVDAVAAYYPFATVTDPDAMGRTDLKPDAKPNQLQQYLGQMEVFKNRRAEMAMPMTYIEQYKDPIAPFVIVNGSADKVVNPRQSVDLAAALKARNAEVSHFVVPGLGHAFVAFNVKRRPALEPSACAVLHLFATTLK